VRHSDALLRLTTSTRGDAVQRSGARS
jgi:hypothetical protein